MKTPSYVGVVTRHYRKYIDLILNNISLDNESLKDMIKSNLNIKNPNTNLTDKEEITQVFNRGGFSTGHFKPTPNKDLIFKDKPNNMGIYIGTISHINENKGHLKLTLENHMNFLRIFQQNVYTNNISLKFLLSVPRDLAISPLFGSLFSVDGQSFFMHLRNKM